MARKYRYPEPKPGLTIDTVIVVSNDGDNMKTIPLDESNGEFLRFKQDVMDGASLVDHLGQPATYPPAA